MIFFVTFLATFITKKKKRTLISFSLSACEVNYICPVVQRIVQHFVNVVLLDAFGEFLTVDSCQHIQSLEKQTGACSAVKGPGEKYLFKFECPFRTTQNLFYHVTECTVCTCLVQSVKPSEAAPVVILGYIKINVLSVLSLS